MSKLKIKTTPDSAPIDPLYTIFEQHLFNFQDPNTDRKTFTEQVVKEYLSKMRSWGLLIPISLESHIMEELSFQVSAMLVKKIYGCLTINEYTKKMTPDQAKAQKKKARVNYRTLEKVQKKQA